MAARRGPHRAGLSRRGRPARGRGCFGNQRGLSRHMPDADGPVAPDPGSPGAPVAKRPLLLQRDFAALWWGQLISLWGDRLNYLALNGLVQQHTRDYQNPGQSSLMLSLHGTVSVLPVLLFAPFAGPWVDRWDLRRVLIVSDLARALCVLAIPFIYHATHLATPVWTLMFLVFTCNVFFLPAKSAMTPEIVPHEQRVRGHRRHRGGLRHGWLGRGPLGLAVGDPHGRRHVWRLRDLAGVDPLSDTAAPRDRGHRARLLARDRRGRARWPRSRGSE